MSNENCIVEKLQQEVQPNTISGSLLMSKACPVSKPSCLSNLSLDSSKQLKLAIAMVFLVTRF